MIMASNGEGQKLGISTNSKAIDKHAKEIERIVSSAKDRNLTDDEISTIKDLNDEIQKRSQQIGRALIETK